MRRRTGWLLLLTFGLISAGGFPGLAETDCPLTNPGFEAVDKAGAVAGWQTVDPQPASAKTGSSNRIWHSGTRSFSLQLPVPGSLTVMSDPVELQVGHLYRLSAWVKTERAFSDSASRYPTAVPACLTMKSFPFTNHSPAAGADSDWREISVLFYAIEARDRIRLHLGFNGTATGQAWFDDVRLEKVEDIRAAVPPETIRWFGPAFRFDERGWIYVHVEGEPYERGYQYGHLLNEEIVAYLDKLAVLENSKEPAAGWRSLRFITDALLLRKYDEEYLLEMKGIADGAAKAGAKYDGKPLEMLDIAVLNSVIDLGQIRGALSRTATPLSGINFLKNEDELLIREEYHKCSAFSTSGSATVDGDVVFGQMFMWNGYTGVHWNVVCDVQPAKGHRFILQTFPGGIHSGSDFYINDAGLIIGETTVNQTPFNFNGTPQSNRIRKAIQYASTIDEVVAIMTKDNNGQYTNEWPYAQARTGETGIFLLGTDKYKLWRSTNREFPGGLTDFYWCNNNNKDLEVRKEYILNPDNAPFDLVFRPWNRDVAFNQFYDQFKGKIDITAAVNLWASSPINRSHACTGELTTGKMAKELMALLHYGKTTLREKFPGTRLIAPNPGATPHLSLGYFTPSARFMTGKIQSLPAQLRQNAKETPRPSPDLSEVTARYQVEKRKLWRNTVFPEAHADNWFNTASAAYWRILDNLPEKAKEAAEEFENAARELNCSLLYVISREGDLAPVQAGERYDVYAHYQIPRIRGTFALHQLRLLLGNDTFLKVMDTVHTRYANRNMSTAQFLAVAGEVSGKPLEAFLGQWIKQPGLPRLSTRFSLRSGPEDRWTVELTVAQEGNPWHLLGSIDLLTGGTTLRKPVEISGAATTLTFECKEKPVAAIFNAGHDFPVEMERFYSLSSFTEDFQHTLIVYGTSRQIEANHTLALNWQTTLADAYTETLVPLRKDCEVTENELAGSDLMILGQTEDNSLLSRLSGRLPGLETGKNYFRWQGTTFSRPDDGLIYVIPNPFNPRRVLYLILANSALQLYDMTKRWQSLPSWALFRGERVIRRGYHPVDAFVSTLEAQ